MNYTSNPFYTINQSSNNSLQNEETSNDLIYHDSASPNMKSSALLKSNTITNAFISHPISEKRTKMSMPSFITESINELCEFCAELLILGEVVYFCLCEKYYHPNCLTQQCPNYQKESCFNCKKKYMTGIYKLPNPLSSLNDNDEISYDQNTTCEKTMSMDTNINKLGNYEHMCDLAFQMSPNIIAEMINNHDKANFLLNNNSNTKEELTRIALSPINLINTPYSGSKSHLISSTKDYFPMQQITTTPSIGMSKRTQLLFGQSPDISLNGIKQHLTFNSNNKKEAQITTTTNILTNNHNNTIYSFFEQNYNKNNQQQVSFRKLLFDDLDINENVSKEEYNEEEPREFDEDKENIPPLPKENSKYSHNFNQGDNGTTEMIEINIEAGLSHIVSNGNKTVEIPITIDLKLKDEYISRPSLYNYSKDTLFMFNTQELNIDTIYQIIKCAYQRMNDGDRMFSNVFNFSKWVTKSELFEILSNGNFASFFQESIVLNYTEIAKLILFGIDLSFEFHSNIFSIVLINDIDEISSEVSYIDELKTVSAKIKESNVSLLKSFTINTMILDDLSKAKTPQNAKFISYLNDISMLSMGYFYSPKNINELIKSVNLFYATIDQSSLLNIRMNIKGNKDPSIYLEPVNYITKKKSHNNYEVYIGSLLRNEKKTLNITATVILNTSIALSLPLLEVSCEYLVAKPKKNRPVSQPIMPIPLSFTLNNITSTTATSSLLNMQNLLIARTNYYPISIAVISHDKEVIKSNTVFIKSICSKIILEISDCITLYKEFKFEESYQKLIDTHIKFDMLIKEQSGIFKHLKLLLENSVMNISCPKQNHHINDRNTLNFSNIDNEEINLNNLSNFNVSTLNINSNLAKVLQFVYMIAMDINYLIEQSKNRNIDSICQVISIEESLLYFRAVMLNDDRFIDDNYDKF